MTKATTRFPTIGQRIDIAADGWTRAEGHRSEESPYLKENGYTGEDWNFALHQAIPNPLANPEPGEETIVLGFGQGVAGAKRVRWATELRGGPRFDVLLFTMEESKACLQGVFLNALQLDDDEIKTIKKSGAWKELQNTREAEIRAALGDGPLADKAVKRFRKDDAFKWAVAPENVRRFDEPVRLKPWFIGKRFTNALDWSRKPWWKWAQIQAEPEEVEDEDLPASHEGRVLVKTHKVRERDTVASRARKKALLGSGDFYCQACGLDPRKAYGQAHLAALHLHHAVPLSTYRQAGAQTDPKNMVLLCPTCHAVAHTTERLTLNAVRQVIAPGWPAVGFRPVS